MDEQHNMDFRSACIDNCSSSGSSVTSDATCERELCEPITEIDLTTQHQEDEIERVICHIAPVHTLRHSQQPSESERALVLVQDGDLSYCVPKRHFRLWAKYHARVQWDFENWPAGFEPELQPMDNGHFFFDLDEWANIRELAMVVMGADEGQIVCGCSGFKRFYARKQTHGGKNKWSKVPTHLKNDRWTLSHVLNKIKPAVERKKGQKEGRRVWLKGVGQRFSCLLCCVKRG